MSCVLRIYTLMCPRLLLHCEPSHLGASQIYSHARADISNLTQCIRYGAEGNPVDMCIASICLHRTTALARLPGPWESQTNSQSPPILTAQRTSKKQSNITLDANHEVLYSAY